MAMANKDIIELFEKCYEEGKAEFSEIHKDFKADKLFIQFGKQLVNDDGSELNLKGRPRFVINKLLQYVKDVTNDMRRTSIAAKVYPVDNGADIGKAKARQGVARGIERMSKANLIYAYAGEEMVTGGMGAWRIDIEPVSDKSFDKTMRMRRILDASTVIYGPGVESDYSDSRYCIIEQKCEPFLKYSTEYDKMRDKSTKTEIWGSYDSPAEFEFWYRHEVDDLLYRFRTGVNVFKSQLEPNAPDKLFMMKDGKRLQEKRTRRYWKQYRIKHRDVLEKNEWPGNLCPIVVASGREVVVEGEKRRLLSLCRYSKDSQRLYNYARQEMGRKLGFSPKAMWLSSLRAIPSKFRVMWNSVHKKTYGTLYYNDIDEAGRPIPPPTMIQGPPIDPALSQETAITDNELKDTTGIQAENLAQRSNATSGKAILAKQAEGNNSTFDYQVYLASAVEYSTKVIVDLIPKVIDTQRQIRYVGEDDAEEVIMANKEYKDKKSGEIKMDYYFNEEEEYDVGVSIGPDHESKRQENSDNLLELMKISQLAAMKLPYMYVKQLDFDMAEEAAELLRPPDMPGGDDEDGPQLPPQVVQKLQMIPQMKQVIEQLSEELKNMKTSQAVDMAKIAQKESSDERKAMIDQQKVNIEKFEAAVNAVESNVQNQLNTVLSAIKGIKDPKNQNNVA